MKNTIITTLSIVLCIQVFAQNTKYEYQGRLTPSYKKEDLLKATFISDIAPDLWKHLRLSASQYSELNNRGKTQGYYNYNTIVDYISVTISTSDAGKTITARSLSDKLTPEQKRMLSTVDYGDDIDIQIVFKYKIEGNESIVNSIVKGNLTVVATPAHEAEFFCKQGFSGYITEQIQSIIKQTGEGEKIREAIVIFTVDEKGSIVDAGIFRTSKDRKVDVLLLDMIRKMPEWKPATNTMGEKVKQQFKISFSSGGC